MPQKKMYTIILGFIKKNLKLLMKGLKLMNLPGVLSHLKDSKI
ncbi:MAG: hypothetical protein QW487_07675 [Candidatus Bathyarchaeia archaeon]